MTRRVSESRAILRRPRALPPAGARFPVRRDAASRSTSRSVKPAAASIATTRGLPSVSVPVLSTTSTSTRARSSSASAFLISTPACAPRPVPTMMAIGVASPKAQGHATISTATLLTSAWARRGIGPHTLQIANVRTAASTTAGHEVRGDSIGETLDRRAGALRLADHADDLRQQHVTADPLGAHRDGPVDGNGRPDHAIAGVLVHRNRLAGHHRLVHRGFPVDDHTVNGDLLARTHAKAIAALHGFERHVVLPIGANYVVPFSAPGRATAGWHRRSDDGPGVRALDRAARAP